MFYSSNEVINKMEKVLPKESKEEDINLDIADVETILQEGDRYIIFEKEVVGENCVQRVLQDSINSLPLKNVKGVLICFEIHPDLALLQLMEAVEIIEDYAHEESSIIFGTKTESSLSKEFVRVTVVFAGD